MTVDSINQRISEFQKRFGEAHLFFAYHAAFPFALTPDLAYRIWTNFQRDNNGNLLKSPRGRVLQIPWIAVADLLLSNFCKEAAHELYEMEAPIRTELLRRLRQDERFGPTRLIQLAKFIEAYVEQHLRSDDEYSRNFASVQIWVVSAYTRPNQLAAELAEQLAAKVRQDDKPGIARLSALLETVQEPLQAVGLEPLLVYARHMEQFARGRFEEPRAYAQKFLQAKQELHVAGVPLPIPEELYKIEGDIERATPETDLSDTLLDEEIYKKQADLEIDKEEFEIADEESERIIGAYSDICCGCMRDAGGKDPCPYCGTPLDFQNEPPALPPRVLLHNKYLIGKCLGKGGFGITYLALDIQLKRLVAIKEYFPVHTASRFANSTSVKPFSQDYADDFEYGLAKFLEEAQMFARFNHSCIVPVLFFFRENGTAYFVTRYFQGQTLEMYMKELQGFITEKNLLRIMLPILSGLKTIHASGVLHLDIKPENIYIPNKGNPFLLDFGAARQAMMDVNLRKGYSIFLTPGYAALEQYGQKSQRGAFTDIYACGATMYACFKGNFRNGHRLEPPESSPDRATGIQLSDIQKVSRQKISERIAQAVMKSLAIDSKDRPQTVDEFLNMLGFSSIEELTIELLVLSGEFKGQKIPLSERMIMIGKDPKMCDLILTAPGISNTHCQIFMRKRIVYIEDLDSKSGTWINERKIPANKEIGICT